MLLLISEDSVLHYKINNNSTNEDSFLDFMKEAVDSLKDKIYDNFIIIMDNLKAYKTAKLINFYTQIKLIFYLLVLTVPILMPLNWHLEL